MALNQTELRAAVAFNLRRSFDMALIRRIQRTAGSVADGVFGPVTVQLVFTLEDGHRMRVSVRNPHESIELGKTNAEVFTPRVR